MDLLDSQKQWIREMVEAVGFSWGEFSLDTKRFKGSDDVMLRRTESLLLPVLSHKPTTSKFVFDNESTDDWIITMTPGVEKASQNVHVDSWMRVQGWVKQWIDLVRREIGAQQWWEAVAGQPRLGIATDVPRQPFTLEEQETVSQRLDEIEERIIREQALNEDHRMYVHQEFADIKEMLKTMDKKTFRQAVLGYAISIGASVASNPGVVSGIVRLFSHAVSPHTGGAPLLPDVTLT